MKQAFAVLTIALLLCSFISLPQSQYSGEVVVASRSKAWLLEAGKIFLDQLPQENGLKAKQPKASKEGAIISVTRSFIVHKKQLSVLSHAVADVSYTLVLRMEDGKYQYDFTEIKAYPYQRDRYGKYSRISSRGKSIKKLNTELRQRTQMSIDQHIKAYIEQLKAQLR